MRNLIYILLFACSVSFGQSLPILQKLAYTQANVITGTEIYTVGDAADLSSESNSVYSFDTSIGWSSDGTKSSIVSTGTDFQNGSYSFLITAETSGITYAIFRFQGTDGLSYKISFYSKAGTGVDQTFRVLSGFTTTTTDNISDPNWTYHEYTYVSSGTGTKQILFYPAYSGNIGDTLYIDSISILEQ